MRRGGRLWFAGDLRFGGVVALPGGRAIGIARTEGCAMSATLEDDARAIRAGLMERSVWR